MFSLKLAIGEQRLNLKRIQEMVNLPQNDIGDTLINEASFYLHSVFWRRRERKRVCVKERCLGSESFHFLWVVDSVEKLTSFAHRVADVVVVVVVVFFNIVDAVQLRLSTARHISSSVTHLRKKQ